ncbi:type IV toxin-antitoxin system AbiEi family antitoxin [Myxococcus sp. SDU36]|uniref:type IV toxin-antitoxin system AbiEi family antitoxin domain-containing protein n=1 Tax=Myxococcus sp. SDU36 TaxID=2831967 RepID=UPI002542FE97|nr:type IV toxin-antitoxin system AbiEi family antitoxin [Myxococcus sp. SDU36]WIG94327.1 hypothetical protein KGD87_27815 [Myxococcus sp. SDU36]
MKLTYGKALVHQLAAENRRVVSDWRALLLLRRASHQTKPEDRRWRDAPTSLEAIHPIMSRLVNSNEFALVEGCPHVYEALAPYGRSGIIGAEEVLMEAHPFAALSHITALAFHGLTDDFPQEIHAVVHSGPSSHLIPPGIQQEDWAETGWAAWGRMPKSLFGQSIDWHRLRTAPSDFGTAEYRPHGYPVRVTTPERTLVDGLAHPEWCGGLQKVLQAWVQARDVLNVDALVEFVDTLNQGVLRQRTGFVMEQLGLHHAALQEWPHLAKRGGSSRLAGSEPFAPTFNDRWKLSINAPIEALHPGAGE